MKSKFVIAFLSFLLITSIVGPSVFALVDADLQTALVDSVESEEQKEAKEKELEEKKLISQFAVVDVNAHGNAADNCYKLLLSTQFTLLREVPIPPPEVVA